MIPAFPQTPRSWWTASVMIVLAVCSFNSQAQLRDPDSEPWREAASTPPASFKTDQLQTFDVAQGAALTYGIDPQTLSVGADGVVRYVLVAKSGSGALNVLYQGIRCETAEVKTYGRWDNQTSWNTSAKDAWQALSFRGPSRPAMMLARGGVCEGRTITGTPQKILHTLKNGRPDVR
ncbi:MAG: CNP1-like family protein [Hydrogenophaga sp.]